RHCSSSVRTAASAAASLAWWAPRRCCTPWKRRAVADRLARTLSADGAARGLAAVTTELVEEARVRHGTLPTAPAALGRALTAGLLLGGLSKADERVSLQFSGDGPLGSILVDATPGGHVRGFVSRPQTHLPARAGKLDVGGAVGRGVLCVMRIPLGEASPYRSIVPLVSGEIGTDVASYLAGSEQIPSVVGVGVFVHADGRVGAAVVARGRAERMDVRAHERRAEVVCEFCGARYVVEEEELRALVSGS